MKINFGDNFRRLRKNRGITQEKIAEVLGVSFQSVSRWELGVCYPDFELLPAISAYFGVSIDEILSNDASSREKEKEKLKNEAQLLEYGSDDQVDFMKEMCNKFPEDDIIVQHLVASASYNISNNPSNKDKYMPILRNGVERLSETEFRDSSISCMIDVCNDDELDYWLERLPMFHYFTRRDCLSSRYFARNEDKKFYINQGLSMIETLSNQLKQRYLDRLGAKKKAEYIKSSLNVIQSFGNGQNIPDGWKTFYARQQLVYAACLFRMKEFDKAWEEFDSSVEKYKYIFDLKSEFLDLGGELFSNLRAQKDWWAIVDSDGNKYECCDYNHSYCSVDEMYYILTDSRWHWFDSVRDNPRYIAAVEWAKESKSE